MILSQFDYGGESAMPYNVTVSTGDVADKAAQIQREAAELDRS